MAEDSTTVSRVLAASRRREHDPLWHWKVLALDRTQVTPDEVKRQFKRLALAVHPDKSFEQGAAEAFTAVSDALHAAFADAERRAPGAHDGGSGRAAKGAATPSPGGAPSDKLWPKMDPTRSHFDILEELRAFEAAFVSELNAGAAERAEAKRRKADARAEEEAAATVRRRQEQEQWLEVPENTTELEERASGWASFRQQGMKGKRKGASAAGRGGKASRTTTMGSGASRQAVRHSVYGLLSEHSRQHIQSERRDVP